MCTAPGQWVHTHQRHRLYLATDLDTHIWKVDSSNTFIFSTIFHDFLSVLSIDSQEYQKEMEQWKGDLTVA